MCVSVCTTELKRKETMTRNFRNYSGGRGECEKSNTYRPEKAMWAGLERKHPKPKQKREGDSERGRERKGQKIRCGEETGEGQRHTRMHHRRTQTAGTKKRTSQSLRGYISIFVLLLKERRVCPMAKTTQKEKG